MPPKRNSKREAIRRAVRDVDGNPEEILDKSGAVLGIFVPSDSGLFPMVTRKLGRTKRQAGALAQVREFLLDEIVRLSGPWNAHSVEVDVLWQVFHRWRREIGQKTTVSKIADFEETLRSLGLRVDSGKAWAIAFKSDLFNWEERNEVTKHVLE